MKTNRSQGRRRAPLHCAIALLLSLTLVSPSGLGQLSKNSFHGLSPELRNRCTMCHSCNAPTKSNPCLTPCPRVKQSTGVFTPADGPGLILMNRMTGGKYGPVPFNHRSHAQMAEMSGGCYGCHHYNDTELRILSCESCHPTERKRDNVSLPDLTGAYHRRCLDCHRQWAGSPECASCHLQDTEGKTAAQILQGYTGGEKAHPPVPMPEKKVYNTKDQDGTVVTFFHGDHSKRFGLKCVDCHRQEGCVTCHDKRPPELRKKAPLITSADFDSRHSRCTACHEGQACSTCHRTTEAEPFDHGRTSGWALKPYHSSLPCSRCHGATKKFAGLKNDCTVCHTGWSAESFNHALTGLKLDETHAAVDCIECHPGKSFGKPPVCSGCHPDKSYPKFKPGTASGK